MLNASTKRWKKQCLKFSVSECEPKMHFVYFCARVCVGARADFARSKKRGLEGLNRLSGAFNAPEQSSILNIRPCNLIVNESEYSALKNARIGSRIWWKFEKNWKIFPRQNKRKTLKVYDFSIKEGRLSGAGRTGRNRSWIDWLIDWINQPPIKFLNLDKEQILCSSTIYSLELELIKQHKTLVTMFKINRTLTTMFRMTDLKLLL